MPFESQAQRRWMWANKPQMAKEWAAATPSGAELPVRVPPKAPVSPAAKRVIEAALGAA